MEVVADAFRFGKIYNTNGAFKQWLRDFNHRCRSVGECEQKVCNATTMKERFVAFRQCGSNALAFSRPVPIGCGSNRSRICSETDKNGFPSITFARELSNVPLAA